MQMSQIQTALVTGGSGFVGRRLVARLKAEGWTVLARTDDIRRIERCDQPAGVVFHLAAVTRPDDFAANPAESYDVNVTGTQAVLDYCRRVEARCIFTSTSAVYAPTTDGQPLAEDAPLKPTSPYGTSKWLAENLCHRSTTPVTILRLFNVYGPGQNPAFLVPYIFDCLREDRPLSLRRPDAQRDFVYVDDVIEALLRAVDGAQVGGAVFNIGSGQTTRILDVVRAAERAVGRAAVEIKTADSARDEVSISVANIKRARQVLGWRPQYDLPRGLAAMAREMTYAGV